MWCFIKWLCLKEKYWSIDFFKGISCPVNDPFLKKETVNTFTITFSSPCVPCLLHCLVFFSHWSHTSGWPYDRPSLGPSMMNIKYSMINVYFLKSFLSYLESIFWWNDCWTEHWSTFGMYFFSVKHQLTNGKNFKNKFG